MTILWPFLRQWWPVLAIAAGLVASALLYRSHISRAREAGRAECEAAQREAQQLWRDSYDKRRAEIAADDEARRDTYEREAAPIRERIIYEAARPGACRHSDDTERLLDEQRRAANRQIAAATGGTVQGAADRAQGDGAEHP